MPLRATRPSNDDMNTLPLRATRPINDDTNTLPLRATRPSNDDINTLPLRATRPSNDDTNTLSLKATRPSNDDMNTLPLRATRSEQSLKRYPPEIDNETISTNIRKKIYLMPKPHRYSTSNIQIKGATDSSNIQIKGATDLNNIQIQGATDSIMKDESRITSNNPIQFYNSVSFFCVNIVYILLHIFV